jgi:hypothetical protein
LTLFESRLLAEGIRSVEDDSLTLTACININKEKSFESLLFERAELQNKSLQISGLFLHFKKLISNLYLLLAILLFITGGVAVRNVLFTEPLISVNFFWAFALFFIPNILLLMLWLLFFFKPILTQNSSLASFSLMLIKQFEAHFNKHLKTEKSYQSLFKCYFNIHFGKDLGRYQLSILTHLLWLCYFSGATLMSIVMLATHQVDFIWQTSILSSDAFQALTQLLAYLPLKLGLPAPSIEQIQQSYFTTDNLLDAENRRLAWSSLLISSLFLYGLLPRLCLFLLMAYKLKSNKTAYRLDLSNAYYVQLRQILKPNKTSLGITDADDDISERQVNVNYKGAKKLSLPEDSYPIAIELSDKQHHLAIEHLKLYNSKFVDKLINGCDYQAQKSILDTLKKSKSYKIIIYVSVNRLPDRGLKRFIGELTSLPDREFQLFMIVEKNHSRQRNSDWYQLANDVGIKLDNILHIEVNKLEVEGTKHE